MSVSCELWFGKIGFVIFEDGVIWLKQDDGEGMEVGSEEIEKLLQDYYQGRF